MKLLLDKSLQSTQEYVIIKNRLKVMKVQEREEHSQIV